LPVHASSSFLRFGSSPCPGICILHSPLLPARWCAAWSPTQSGVTSGFRLAPSRSTGSTGRSVETDTCVCVLLLQKSPAAGTISRLASSVDGRQSQTSHAHRALLSTSQQHLLFELETVHALHVHVCRLESHATHRGSPRPLSRLVHPALTSWSCGLAACTAWQPPIAAPEHRLPRGPAPRRCPAPPLPRR
jgi:hypothetical protein